MDTASILRESSRVAKINSWEVLHTPVNLSQALTVEANELMEAVSSPNPSVDKVASEIADVQMYLLALAKSLNVDVEQAVVEKQTYNQRRFNTEQ